MSERSGRLAGFLSRFLFLAAGTAALLFAAFGLYARHVMSSPFIEHLQGKSASYACIGAILDPQRRQDAPQFQIAFFYLEPGQEAGPHLAWHFRSALAASAIRWSSGAERINRMAASLPMGSKGDFDGVALTHSGRRYCELDAPHRQAILDFYWSGRPLRSARTGVWRPRFGKKAGRPLKVGRAPRTTPR
ncbi:MAG: hypothetical protein QOH81_3008 [Sphingomonadales bacterium]|nr:hypothetical protein [Sphingomonadales bacterium]